MKVTLEFERWEDARQQQPTQAALREVEMGPFHAGSVFRADVNLSPDDAAWLDAGAMFGIYPVFRIVMEEGEKR